MQDRLERVLDELVQLTPGVDDPANSEATRSWSSDLTLTGYDWPNLGLALAVILTLA